MTKLICPSCGTAKTAAMNPIPQERACDCGASMVEPWTLKPRKPLRRVSEQRAAETKGRGSKRGQPKRDWQDARAKVELEGACRLCRVESLALQAAHIIGRKHDEPAFTGTKTLYVNPLRVVPLCPTCHQRYDAHDLDLLGYLAIEEQVRAVEDAGGIELARKRIAPTAYRMEAAA